MATDSHLQMIQAAITRLASHSTTIKGWSVTLSGALLGYGATANTPIVAVIAGYVIAAFAIMDGYYLALERQYRQLYRQTVAGKSNSWEMDIPRPSVAQIVTALRSPVIVILYGSSLLVAVCIGTYLAIK